MEQQNPAREILQQQECSCVVVRGKQVWTETGIGVKPLMKFLRQDRRFFDGASVADKVIGKAAAMLLAASGAANVYGAVMSEAAITVFQNAGIPYSFSETVPFIRNRTDTGMCPLEEAVLTLENPADAFAVLEKRIAELMSGGVVIRKAVPDDAQSMLAYLKLIGGESDNLTFGEEGIPFSEEEEEKYIKSVQESADSILLVAVKDGRIIGDASFAGNSQERLKHRGELGIAVVKDEWGKGIAHRLMEQLLAIIKNELHAEIVSLEVRSDNQRAIHLYKTFGFQKIGQFKGFLKINGKNVDFDLMNLYL